MQRGRYKRPDRQIYYRINHQITASEVRVIGEDNKQVGVMPLSAALQQARTAGLDLVEVAPKARPPVAKIIDYKKFQYLEAKKFSQQKKTAKKGEMKEIRLRPFIAEADYNVRLKKIKAFISDGHQVRLSVPFQGRELSRKEIGYQLIRRLAQDLGELAKLDQEPKFIGRQVLATISANKK